MQNAQRSVSPREETAMVVGRSCCIAGAAIGLMGLLGSVFEVHALTTVLPGQPPMQPNTAICLTLIGTIAALRREHWCYKAFVLPALGVVLLIAAGSLAEYALAIDLGIDQAFIASAYGPHPGRPSPLTAFSLLLLSLAITVYRSRPAARFRPSELLIVLAGTVAYTALIGMLYNAGPLYRMANAPVIGVALPTGIALLLISIGLMLQHPHAGMTAVIISEGPGGILFRRLLIPILAGPVLLDVLIDRLLWVPLDPQTALLTACHAVAISVVGLALVIVNAAQLNRMHSATELSHARVGELIEHASDGIFVADLDGRYTKVNTAGCEMLGYRRDEIIGKQSSISYRPATFQGCGSRKPNC